MTDEEKLRGYIDEVRAAIRLDWMNLATKPLVTDERKAIRQHIEKCHSALRVRPISSSRITEFSQHEANGCEAQEDQAAEVEIFPVLGKPAATIEPRNGALDDPSARQN